MNRFLGNFHTIRGIQAKQNCDSIRRNMNPYWTVSVTVKWTECRDQHFSGLCCVDCRIAKCHFSFIFIRWRLPLGRVPTSNPARQFNSHYCYMNRGCLIWTVYVLVHVSALNKHTEQFLVQKRQLSSLVRKQLEFLVTCSLNEVMWYLGARSRGQ
jgi:hypothetical protein